MRIWKSVTLTVAAASSLVLAGLASPASAHEDDHGTGNTVLMQDRCDPMTFNAAVGPGTCVATSRHHRVTFDRFLNRLTTHPADVLREANARGWRFDPTSLTIKTGTPLLAKNTGGEQHSFTLVQDFAHGGCIPIPALNLGLPANPVCATNWPATIVMPGTTMTIPNLAAGTYMYQCMIHPWMRTTVTVSDTATATMDDDDD